MDDIEKRDEVMRTRVTQPNPDGNLFDKLTQYVDENIRTFRYMPWLIGGAGVVVLLGSSNMLRRYKGVKTIPQMLIQTHSSLYGKVVKTDYESIYIWHTPLLRRLTGLGAHPPAKVSNDELIRVQFSGVSIATDTAATWLNKTLSASPVQCRPLYRTDHSVECIVYSWRVRWLYYAPRRKYCVNEELVSLGLGTMAEPRGLGQTVASVKFLRRLAKQEKAAQLKGRGVWYGTDHVSTWNRISQWFRGKLGRRIGDNKSLPSS